MKSNNFPFLVLIFALTSITKSYSQALTLDFAKQFNGTGQSKINTIKIDNSGNIYSAGSFNGSVDFDPGIGSSIFTGTNIINAFISKLDNNGNFIWAKQLGGNATGTEVQGIDLDGSGNLYCTGSFIGTADLDPGPGTSTFTSGMAGDAFIIKLDGNGNFTWAKVFSNPGGDNCGMSINIDGDGNIVSTGFFLGPLDFDPGAGTFLMNATSPLCNVYVSKLDANGNFIWAKHLNGTVGGDVSRQLTTDAAKNIYITGHFAGTVDFDPGPGANTLTAVGQKDIFTIKLDLNGNLLWVNSAGGSGNDGGRSIDLNSSGKTLTAGNFSTTVDFDPGPGTATLASLTSLNGYIAEFNTAGSLVWAKQIASNSTNEINSAIYDQAGNIFVAGTFSGTADFDPGNFTYTLTSAGDYDSFLLKLDPSGNFMWAFNTGSANSERCYTIRSNQVNSIISAGAFSGLCDFDPSLSSFTLNPGGVNNSYITKICDNCLNGIDEQKSVHSLRLFPNPASNEIHISYNANEIVTIEVTDLSGRILMQEDKQIVTNEIILKTNSLNSGYYLLHVRDKSGIQLSSPILIQK